MERSYRATHIHWSGNVTIRSLLTQAYQSELLHNSGELTSKGNHKQILISLLSEEERLLAFPSTQLSNLLSTGKEKGT
ncbi:hypothetical protein, partial [Klebsiella pneumoniae]|uniref:hypothetical protein n=1 Tax=Klebsiella pneumoniae TaxID=573 RepID=UPI00210A7236